MVRELWARWRHHLVATAVLLVLSGSLVRSSFDARDILPDEAEWVTSGLRTFELYRDLAAPEEWEGAYTGLGDWGNMNPPVGKLIIGIGLAFVHEQGDRTTYITTWPFDRVKNAAAGNFPPQHYLVAGRLAVALFGSACLVLVYICAVQLLRRRWEPLVAPVVLFGTAAFQVHASHVFTDMPQIAFLLAAVAALQSFIASGRRWMFFLALSFIGLSCAVKFSTAPVVVAAMIVFVGARGTIVRRVGRLLAIAIIPFAVFVVVNPYLYPAPITRSLELVERWSATKRAQQSMPSIANQAVTSPIQRVALVTARGVLVPKAVWPLLPLGLVVGLAILAFLIQTGRSELARRPCTIVVASGVAAVLAANVLDGPALLLPLLAGAGAVELVLRVKARDGVWTHYAAVLAVFLIFTALWLPFDWSRYYLPVIALMSVVYAAGVARIVEVTSWT